MDRVLTFYDLPTMDALPRLERWLYRDAAPAVLSAHGPLLTRYETYRSGYIPLNLHNLLSKYGTYAWRMVESYWLEPPAQPEGMAAPEGAMAIPPMPRETGEYPPITVRLPLHATEDYKGAGKTLYDFPSLVRWVVAIRYPDSVSKEEADIWYREVHARDLAKQKKLVRLLSSRALPSSDFDRVTELWYEDMAGWHESVVRQPLSYTRPPWAAEDAQDITVFFRPYQELVGIFLSEHPECDFLQELGPYTVTS